MRFSLGNTTRGLIAGAIIGNAAILVGSINGTTSWTAFLCGVITSIAALAGAVIDPGSAPTKEAAK